MTTIFSYEFSANGFKKKSKFLKVYCFSVVGSIFSLKLSYRLKTVSSRLKKLKRYCKGTLNMLFNKILMTTKNIYLCTI